jgi:hypothetical protein
MGRASFILVPALALVTMALVSTPTAAQASPRHAADWTQQHPLVSPAARAAFGMASDPATHTVVLFGGPTGTHDNPALANDTWTWDGRQWTQQHPLVSPSARFGPAMVFDPATRTVLLFGGEQFPPFVFLLDTWTWDGTNWTQQHPAHFPPNGIDTMAFDPATHRVLALESTNGPLDNTWTWDGTDWIQLHPAHEPTNRSTTMASDPANHTVVLFGGIDNTSSANPPPLLTDTWTWDGTDWTQRKVAQHPAGRFDTMMAFGSTSGFGKHQGDSLDNRSSGAVVLFGGGADLSERSVLNDTWTWNGTHWTEQNPALQPPPRLFGQMVTDPNTHTVVLFGGATAGGATGFSDTWVFAPIGHGDGDDG